MDFKTMTDEELEAARASILIEQERRANLEQIPATISELAAKFTDGGGDVSQLEAAIKMEVRNE